MGKIFRTQKLDDSASIGIGALIVFIAIVLVAGIAASVLIQASVTVESQSKSTGRETISEVSTSISIFSVEGYAASGADISKLAIMIRPRAGAEEIDLTTTYLELSDTTKKVILNYSTSYYSKPDGLNDIFSANVFPDDDYGYGSDFNTDGTQFGILVFEDYDSSITRTKPVINRGDKVYLCINATGVFNNIAENSDVWGMIVPEQGYGGIIEFRTPYTYIDSVMELLWDM